MKAVTRDLYEQVRALMSRPPRVLATFEHKAMRPTGMPLRPRVVVPKGYTHVLFSVHAPHLHAADVKFAISEHIHNCVGAQGMAHLITVSEKRDWYVWLDAWQPQHAGKIVVYGWKVRMPRKAKRS